MRRASFSVLPPSAGNVLRFFTVIVIDFGARNAFCYGARVRRSRKNRRKRKTKQKTRETRVLGAATVERPVTANYRCTLASTYLYGVRTHSSGRAHGRRSSVFSNTINTFRVIYVVVEKREAEKAKTCISQWCVCAIYKCAILIFFLIPPRSSKYVGEKKMEFYTIVSRSDGAKKKKEFFF